MKEGERRSAGSHNNKLQPPGEGDAGHWMAPPGAPFCETYPLFLVCLLANDDDDDADARYSGDEHEDNYVRAARMPHRHLKESVQEAYLLCIRYCVRFGDGHIRELTMMSRNRYAHLSQTERVY